MSVEATTLTTESVWTFRDLASPGITKLNTSVSSLGRNILVTAAGMAGLGLSFRAIASQIAHANTELEQVEKSLAGAFVGFQNWDKSVPMISRVKASLRDAKEVAKELEEQEIRLAIPLTSLAAAYKSVAGPAFSKLGLSQEKVLSLTIKSAEASKVFGTSSEQAATTIARAMQTKTVRGIDPFAIKLREVVGDMRKLSSAEIYNRIQKGLSDLGPAAEAFSGGFEGTMFRVKNFFESTMRDIGTPTFKRITEIIGQWQKKLAAVTADGRTLAEVYGEKLLNVFKAVESFTTKIVENWKWLVGAWAVSKAPDWLGGLSGGLKSVAAAGGGLGGAAGGALKFAAAAAVPIQIIGTAITIALAANAGIKMLFDAQDAAKEAQNVNRWESQRLGKIEGPWEEVRQANSAVKAFATTLAFVAAEADAGRMPQENALRAADNYNEALDKQGIALRHFRMAMTEAGLATRKGGMELDLWGKAIAGSGAPGIWQHRFEKMNEVWMRMFGIPGEADKKFKTPKGPTFTGDIHITQDFKEADPDRVFIRFKNDLESLADRRVQGTLAEPLGT